MPFVFRLDYKGNKTVHKIVNREQGSTDVVWAGYGSGPVGKAVSKLEPDNCYFKSSLEYTDFLTSRKWTKSVQVLHITGQRG